MNKYLLICATLLSLSLGADNAPACSCSPKQISKVFTAVAKNATPAVVYIKAEAGTETSEEQPQQGQTDPYSNQDFFNDDFFNRFFGQPYRKMQKQPQISQGSGFFVSPDGHIMTNAHVIKGAEKITIVTHDGREMPATIIGVDPSTDIGIIKTESKNIPYLNLGDSEAMEIGEWVVAIGSPFQLQASVTVGVVSAKGRQNLRITDFEDFIQTDAAINPGNSGGPLINLDNEVIGINTAIVSKSGGYMGIGFAIPSNMAKQIMNQLLDTGCVTRGYLGIGLQPLDQDMATAFGLDRPDGALIAEVMRNSPADKAGLKQGDIIIEFNGIPVRSIGSLRNEISMTKPGTKIQLKVNRSGKILAFTVVLGAHSDGKLGMEVEPISSDLAKKLELTDEEGLVVTKIKPGSPAAKAGIRPGFLIMQVNHKKVTTVEEFNKAIEEKKNTIVLYAKFGNTARYYTIKLD